jgi:hypothetical protein
LFSDPQTVTINAIANTLPRISSGPNSSVYQKEDGNVKMTISHQYGKRNRRQVRVDFRKVAADPLATGYNKEYSFSTYLVVDHPPVGFTNTEVKYVVDALSAYLSASSGANVTKLLGGEN